MNATPSSQRESTQSSFLLMDGKLQLYRRGKSKFWQCAASVGGKQRRQTTKKESLQQARIFAEDWYLTLQGKDRAGLLSAGKTLKQVADQFLKEFGVITEGQRGPKCLPDHEARLRMHLIPFFGSLPISRISASKVQEYRVHRLSAFSQPNPLMKRKRAPAVKPPSRGTIRHEINTLRLVLKTGLRHGWLEYLPDMSAPYKHNEKIEHRPWFSPAEYKQLYEASRAYAKDPLRKDAKWAAEQVHDMILFMANTGLRPDETKNLQHRDVEIVADEESGERILEIEVRGKRGVGYCKSTPGAVKPYERLLARAKPTRRRKPVQRQTGPPLQAQPEYPKPTDHVFPGKHGRIFNSILERSNLKLDRDGHPRTSYSLRHTYICMRLMEGADIYQIAKNCRTSVEMIEKHYAAHIKNTLDAAAINIRRPKPNRKKKPKMVQQALDLDNED